MLSFTHFIIESSEASGAFQDAKKIAAYISSEKYKSNYLDALDGLSKAAEEKEIYNAKFSTYKESLIRGIEYAYKTLFDKIRDDIIKSGQETSDLWSMSAITDINKVSKIYSKMSTKNREASDFTSSISGIPSALKSMKAYVKSGREPAPPKPGQFVKPMASFDSSKLALKFMQEAASSFESNLRDNITKKIHGVYNSIKNITDPKKLSKEPAILEVASAIFIARTTGRIRVLELKNNADRIVENIINDNVQSIVDGFVSKNTSKLALILQKKNMPKSHTIIRTNISNGMVENSMSFEFEDSSSFILESSVVYKYTRDGKLFFQYPTRFKNVKLANGSMMKMPSEEKMIKEF